MTTDVHAARLGRVRAAMADRGVQALALSVGPDLPWLTGYEAMPLERLTMLVVPVDGDATLVVPRLEAPRVVERPDVFAVAPWDETDDPIEQVAGLLGAAEVVAIGDRTWARFLVELGERRPEVRWQRASEVVGPLRAVKGASEVASLRRASAAADRVASALQGGEIALVGRTEAEVSAELGRRLLAEGHQRVNFAIVAAGAEAASPHHEPGGRRIAAGEVVLCDFGGTMVDDTGAGYCSDITRCVHLGEPPADLAEAYAVLHEASGSGSTRTPTSSRATNCPSSPATPSRSSRASTCPVGGACASRTSWWPPTPGPRRSTRSTTTSSCSTGEGRGSAAR